MSQQYQPAMENLVYNIFHATFGSQASLEIELISTYALLTELNWIYESSWIKFYSPFLINIVFFSFCPMDSSFWGFELHHKRAITLARFSSLIYAQKEVCYGNIAFSHNMLRFFLLFLMHLYSNTHRCKR